MVPEIAVGTACSWGEQGVVRPSPSTSSLGHILTRFGHQTQFPQPLACRYHSGSPRTKERKLKSSSISPQPVFAHHACARRQQMPCLIFKNGVLARYRSIQ